MTSVTEVTRGRFCKVRFTPSRVFSQWMAVVFYIYGRFWSLSPNGHKTNGLFNIFNRS